MTRTLFDWQDSFLIGIDELDHEHKVLIKDINKLYTEMLGNREKSKIARCLGEVFVHMQSHFALEEHVMKEHDFVFFEEHKREHDEFLEKFTECMLQFLNDEDLSAGNPIDECLKEWVVQHITSSDKKMSLMIKDQVA